MKTTIRIAVVALLALFVVTGLAAPPVDSVRLRDVTKGTHADINGYVLVTTNTTDTRIIPIYKLPVASSNLVGYVPMASLGTNAPSAGQALYTDGSSLYWAAAGVGGGGGLDAAAVNRLIDLRLGYLPIQYTDVTAAADANATSYISALGITSTEAQNRIRGFFGAISSLWARLVDGAILAKDLNDETAPRSLKLAYGTNVTGVVHTYEGALFANGIQNWPVSSPWNVSVVLDYIGYTNYSSPFVQWGLYKNDFTQRQYLQNLGIITVNGGTSTTTGSCFDPYTAGLNWFDGRERIFTTTNDNTSAWWSYVDGLPVDYPGPGSPTAMTGTSDRLTLGGYWTGTGSSYSSYTPMTVRAWLVFSGPLNSNEVRTVEYALRWLNPAKENWVFYGDSLTAPVGTNSDYPYQLMHTFGNEQVADWRNIGISGITAASLNTDTFWNRTLPFLTNNLVLKSRIFIKAGINDLGTGASVETTYQALTNIWNKGRSKGAEVFASLLHIPTHPAWTLAMQTKVVELNKRIMSDSTKYDRLVREDLILPIEKVADPVYCFDGLHLTAEGNYLIAQQIQGFFPSRAANLAIPSLTTLAGLIYLSDIAWIAGKMTNCWTGAISYVDPQLDKNVSGNPLKVNGVTYPKGIGLFPGSHLEYIPPTNSTLFHAEFGIDDAALVDASAGIMYCVFLNTVSNFVTPRIVYGTPIVTYEVSMVGITNLTIECWNKQTGATNNFQPGGKNLVADICNPYFLTGPGMVTKVQNRMGNVLLNSTDISGALNYVPVSAGDLAGITYLSTLAMYNWTNAWDGTNNIWLPSIGTNVWDGSTLSINSYKYPRYGIGLYAPAWVQWDLAGKYSRFVTYVGVDDIVTTNGGVVEFDVYVDTVKSFSRTNVYGEGPTLVDLDVTGKTNVAVQLINRRNDARTDWENGTLGDPYILSTNSLTIRANGLAGTIPNTVLPGTLPSWSLLSTNYLPSATGVSTNQNKVRPDFAFSMRYSDLTTNESFTFLAPTNVDSSTYQWCVVLVTNSAATAKTIAAPANCHTAGTLYMTNVSVVNFFNCAGRWTNMTVFPLW